MIAHELSWTLTLSGTVPSQSYKRVSHQSTRQTQHCLIGVIDSVLTSGNLGNVYIELRIYLLNALSLDFKMVIQFSLSTPRNSMSQLLSV